MEHFETFFTAKWPWPLTLRWHFNTEFMLNMNNSRISGYLCKMMKIYAVVKIPKWTDRQTEPFETFFIAKWPWSLTLRWPFDTEFMLNMNNSWISRYLCKIMKIYAVVQIPKWKDREMEHFEPIFAGKWPWPLTLRWAFNAEFIRNMNNSQASRYLCKMMKI